MRIQKAFQWASVLLVLALFPPRTHTRQYIGQMSAAGAQRLLQSWVGAECPRANAAAIDDWTRVCLLRQWAWRNTPWSSPSALLQPQPDQAPAPLSATHIFADFKSDRGGVWCGGAAYALRRLYEAYGYRAGTYDCGFPDVMTHVVTIVWIRHRQRWLLVVQDPTFNLAYTDETGQPLDIRDLLHRLATRRASSIVVRPGPMHPQRAFLLGPGDSVATYQNYIDPAVPGKRLCNGLRMYRSCLTADTFWQAARGRVANALAQRGLPGECMYLLACPLHTIPEAWLLKLYPFFNEPNRSPSAVVQVSNRAS